MTREDWLYKFRTAWGLHAQPTSVAPLNSPGAAHPDLSSAVASATGEIRDKWLLYRKTIHFQNEVPLANRIASFAPPIQIYLQETYPALNDIPAKIFWMMVFAAIEDSKTHSMTDLNSAMAQLRGRFGSGQGEPQSPDSPSQSTAPVQFKPQRAQTRQQERAALLAAARYFEIDGRPAMVVDEVSFGALRNKEGSWVKEQPAIIESLGSLVTADEFATLRFRELAWDERLTDNLNLNVLLEDCGLIAPPP